MRFKTCLVPAVVACLMLASSVFAGVREDLATLRGAATGMLAGGELDRGQQKAARSVINAIEKAEAVPAGEDPKLLKKLSSVLSKLEKAGRKSVDLSAHALAIKASVDVLIGGLREPAVEITASLQVDADRKKAQSKIDKGDTKVAKAEASASASKAVKNLAKAAKLFAQAADLARKLLEVEREKGLIKLQILRSFLDDLPKLPSGETLVPPGAPMIFHLNLPVDPATVPGDAILLTSRPGGKRYEGMIFVDAFLDGDGTPLLLLALDPPPEFGAFRLTILGEDRGGVFLVTPDAIGMKVTREFDIFFE